MSTEQVSKADYVTVRCFYPPYKSKGVAQEAKRIMDGLGELIDSIMQNEFDTRNRLLTMTGSDPCAPAVINCVHYKKDGIFFGALFEWYAENCDPKDLYNPGAPENPILGLRAYNDPEKQFVISSCILTKEEMIQVLDTERTTFVGPREGSLL
jgi:hypothetical protein